jgi:simple sugar transport system permease protein
MSLAVSPQESDQVAASTPKSSTPPAPKQSTFARLIRRPETGALAGTVLVFIFFSILGGESFLSLGGFASWMNVASSLLIIAIPVGLLMIAGELDLSVGSVLAASSMTMAIVSGTYGAPILIGILAALVVGALAGFINGVITARTNVPSFVVTLGMNFGLAGITLGLSRIITGTTSVPLTTDPVTKALFGSLIGGQFQVAIVWAVVVAVVVAWILQMTPWGNWIFAVGGDKDSARATGIPVRGVKISLFVASGLGAALVGIIQTSFYNGAQTATGQSFVFNSIIAVVIGGVLLTGGYGSITGVILGTLTFAIVNQGIYYTGLSSDWASFILGALLLAAVLMNNTFRRLALSSGPRTPKKKKVS